MAKLAEESNKPKKDVSKRQAVEVLPPQLSAVQG